MLFECDDLLALSYSIRGFYVFFLQLLAFGGLTLVPALSYPSAENLDDLQRFHRVGLSLKAFEDLLHNLPVWFRHITVQRRRRRKTLSLPLDIRFVREIKQRNFIPLFHRRGSNTRLRPLVAHADDLV
jgi:hypothetical protein